MIYWLHIHLGTSDDEQIVVLEWLETMNVSVIIFES